MGGGATATMKAATRLPDQEAYANITKRIETLGDWRGKHLTHERGATKN